MQLTVLSRKSFTLQCRKTRLPNCVVTFVELAWSSKNGKGSAVVFGSGSVNSSYDSVNGEENSYQKFFGRVSKGSPLCVLRAGKQRKKYKCF